MQKSNSYLPQLALILITVIWGGTFLAVQYALNFSTPMFFVGCRFAVAAFAILLISLKSMTGLTLKETFAGTAIGVMIAIGYGTQTIGLQSILSSESAFLTALYVPLVPILMWIIFQKRPALMTWIGTALAFIGLVLLTGNGFSSITLSYGQVLTLICAFVIALEIILIGFFAGKVNLRRVTVVQLIVASVLSFACMPLVGEHQLPAFSWPLVFIAVGLGLASALIQFVMNWAQKMVDPTRAAIIYAGEPVWAGLFGRIAGERLPLLALFGGLLVVLGVLVSELKFKFFENKKES
ncbi:DMT family transporter [Acinetobacter haemolyticus]|uniref:DMT family transporter n=1 Tax=Acinetobacter haemolyticus TaxID=29430 RepID=UPI000C2BDE90|nr:DMT family transporter [Acinetobacter haemolyticus]ATZ66087.1 EamA family transporter [Acinetobacter haemolyticus]MCU4377337.1 DMT family transporter [Acinetobacter haemolyticus]NAR75495.1 EamA family transporter [Acinetobacter haemolyticus]NAS09538.1 EamA family transporter [Acinetobacter haemolyticus]RSN76427.1 DMT family transporter [Acinetobacter haemolyticus]